MNTHKRTYTSLIIVFIFILTLTSLNQSVSAEKQAVVLATMNWEPYYGDTLPDEGFFTVLCRTAFHRAGYDFSVVFVPWLRAVEGAKDGIYDGIMGGYYSKERTQYFLYTDMISKVEAILLSRKNEAISFTSLRDLEPYKIGGIRGGAIEAQWKATGYLTVEEVATYRQNLEKLIDHRIDVIIGERKMLQYLLGTKHQEARNLVEEVLPIIQAKSLYVLISPKMSNYKTVVADFNRALKEIKDDGTYEQIIKEYGFSNP